MRKKKVELFKDRCSVLPGRIQEGTFSLLQQTIRSSSSLAGRFASFSLCWRWTFASRSFLHLSSGLRLRLRLRHCETTINWTLPSLHRQRNSWYKMNSTTLCSFSFYLYLLAWQLNKAIWVKKLSSHVVEFVEIHLENYVACSRLARITAVAQSVSEWASK